MIDIEPIESKFLLGRVEMHLHEYFVLERRVSTQIGETTDVVQHALKTEQVHFGFSQVPAAALRNGECGYYPKERLRYRMA